LLVVIWNYICDARTNEYQIYKCSIYIVLNTVQSLPLLVQIFSQHPAFSHREYEVFCFNEKPSSMLVKNNLYFWEF